MRIDDRIEPLVREALDAVVKEDVNRLDRSLTAFPDDNSRMGALELTAAICRFVIFDCFDGQRPTAEEVQSLAAELAEILAWVRLSTTEIDAFLGAIVNGQPLERATSPKSTFFMCFLIAGSLLGASEKIGPHEWWFNYLDRVESALEALPEPN